MKQTGLITRRSDVQILPSQLVFAGTALPMHHWGRRFAAKSGFLPHWLISRRTFAGGRSPNSRCLRVRGGRRERLARRNDSPPGRTGIREVLRLHLRSRLSCLPGAAILPHRTISGRQLPKRTPAPGLDAMPDETQEPFQEVPRWFMRALTNSGRGRKIRAVEA